MALRRPASVYNVATVLHATLVAMDEHGGKFVSSKQAGSSGALPTSHFVLEKLRTTEHSQLINLNKADYVVDVMYHFKNLPDNPTDDFNTRVKEILNTGVVSERMVGFIVALPHLYDTKRSRTTKLSKFAERYSSSKYIGELGQREEFIVKVLDKQIIHKKNDDGTTQDLELYKVGDQLGNFGFFFAKVGTLVDLDGAPMLDKYDCIVMKATPKKHQVSRDSGIRETQFSRVRVAQHIGKGSEE